MGNTVVTLTWLENGAVLVQIEGLSRNLTFAANSIKNEIKIPEISCNYDAYTVVYISNATTDGTTLSVLLFCQKMSSLKFIEFRELLMKS